MREIESQIIRRDNRTGLFYVRSQYFFQSCVNKMRRGVIPPGSVALFDIDRRDNEVANPDSGAGSSDFGRAYICSIGGAPLVPKAYRSTPWQRSLIRCVQGTDRLG